MSPRTLQFVAPKKEEEECSESRLHYMNFKSSADADSVRTSEYFESQFQFVNNQNGAKNLHASFRGRPMNGREYELPEGYQLSVMSKPDLKKPLGDKLIVESAGRKLTAWNLDKLASTADPVPQFTQWLNLSDALHSHVQLDD